MNRFKKYWYKKVDRGEIAFTYKIIEMGVKDSDPFPKLEIPIDPRKVAKALNEAFYQGTIIGENDE